MRRRTLILSGSIGKGHDTTAAACAAVLDRHGVESRVLDSLSLLGVRSASISRWMFRRLIAIPGVYDALHFSQLRTGGWVARYAGAAARRKIGQRLHTAVAAFAPDLVVSVYPLGAAAASHLKRERPIATVALMTDFLCAPALGPRRH
jgi:processive 1,2-diacylglycerol beta-glucosyltransferase